MDYRFVICVDIEAKNLKEAYKKLCRVMEKGCKGETNSVCEGWESTDEFYEEGKEGDADRLTSVAAIAWNELNI